MRIGEDTHVPVYLQIVEHLRSRIAAGIYRAGEALPSLRALALELKVNPNTVQRAYEEMERQGLTASHRGVGIFVTEKGVRSAQARAEEAVRTAFDQAITAATAAGLGDDQIRELFDAVIAARKGRRT
jgi:GntR family transcriptional regulator